MSTLVAQRSPLYWNKVKGGLPFISDASRFTGNVHFVDSAASGGSDTTGHGSSPDSPFLTIDYAVGRCTANQGDVIIVLPGHAETINTASAIDLDIAGITVIGLGNGEDRPTITVGSSLDTATVEIGAADVMIKNIVFQPGNDGVDILLDINADGAIVEDCEFRSDETNAYQADTYIDINGGGANAADRCVIRRCKIVSITAGSTQAINIGAVEDALVIEDCWIDGDFTAAAILSGSIFTNALIRRNAVSNRAAGVHAIEFTAACTGLLLDNRMYSSTLGTILDPGSLKCLGNLETDAVDQAGVDSPRTSAGGFPDDSITAAAIAAGAIDAATFAAGAIDAAAIATDAIDADALADGAITAATFAAGAIDAAAIAAGAIDAATFAAGAIDAAAIANGAIDAATFAAGAIDAAAIAAAAIDAATFAADALQAMQDEAQDAIQGEQLDHLVSLTDGAGAAILTAVDGSIVSKIISKVSGGDTSSYDNTTDSLEMVSDKFGAFSGDGGAAQDDSVKASLDLAHTDLDSILTNLTTIDDFLDTEIAAILADTGTDGVVIAADGITNAKIADNAFASEQFALSAGEKTTDGIIVTRATAALPQSTSGDIFTVTGLCLLKRIVGYVTVQIGAFANATKLKVNSTGAGATTDICGTLDINAAVVDTNYQITGTFANALVATIDIPIARQQAAEIVVPPGSIMLDCAGSDGGTGRIRWSVTYVPLESGAQIVAA